MRLLTHRAQIFADVRTYWSGDATKRVTGYELEGKAKESDGIIHLLNLGAAIKRKHSSNDGCFSFAVGHPTEMNYPSNISYCSRRRSYANRFAPES